MVELSLSLVFIGILSITAVLIINNTVLAYQRGVVLNRVNTVGMDLVDDMRTAIQGSPIVKEDDVAYVSFVHEGDVEINGSVNSSVPLYGGLCTGKYTYVWKSGYLTDADNMVKVNGNKEFRLAKIKDDKREICADYMGMNDNERAVANFAEDKNYEELLAGESGLVLYDLHTSEPAVNAATRTAYYSVAFILGTKDGGANIMANGDYCVPPEGANSSFNYCAINKFNFAAQAGGINNGEN